MKCQTVAFKTLAHFFPLATYYSLFYFALVCFVLLVVTCNLLSPVSCLQEHWQILLNSLGWVLGWTWSS